MACFVDCGSLMLWVQQKMSQNKVSAIGCEKEVQRLDSGSTTAHLASSISSSSDRGDSDTDEAGNGTMNELCGPCGHANMIGPHVDHVDHADMIDGARSGNGTVETVGVKLDGKIPCPHCLQKFDTEKALNLHCKFIHAGAIFNEGYTLVYEFDSHKQVATSRVA